MCRIKRACPPSASAVEARKQIALAIKGLSSRECERRPSARMTSLGTVYRASCVWANDRPAGSFDCSSKSNGGHNDRHAFGCASVGSPDGRHFPRRASRLSKYVNIFNAFWVRPEPANATTRQSNPWRLCCGAARNLSRVTPVMWMRVLRLHDRSRPSVLACLPIPCPSPTIRASTVSGESCLLCDPGVCSLV